MNARRVSLEVLSAAPADGAVPGTLVLPAEALEETKLAAFEQGYKAGWDDAAAAAAAEADGARREASQALQGLSFGFHEARGHLLEGLGPLLEDICARVLPELAQAALGPVVREALMPLAEQALERPVTIALHPAARAAVEEALAAGPAPPVDLLEDSDLAPGEIQLRAGGEERRIDLDAAVAQIRHAVTDFFTPTPAEEASLHG